MDLCHLLQHAHQRWDGFHEPIHLVFDGIGGLSHVHLGIRGQYRGVDHDFLKRREGQAILTSMVGGIRHQLTDQESVL
jgi:hypothetical protein